MTLRKILILIITVIGILNGQTYTIEPPDSTVFYCNRDTVTVSFISSRFILDTDELYFTINGEVIDTSSEWFSEIPFGIECELHLPPFEPNDTINICVHNIEIPPDIWHEDPKCWQYHMDFDNTPPSIEFIALVSDWDIINPGDSVSTFNWLGFLLQDSLGIDVSSIYITIEDSISFVDGYALQYENDTLMFNKFRRKFHFAEGDSMIDICIHADDGYEPCPNALDTCYQIYLAPRDHCPCKAGFYMAAWIQIRDDVSAGIDMIIDSLSVKYEYFKLDDEINVMDPCSMDVYYIQPFDYYRLPDSMVNRIHNYVYNGGILYMWSECSGGFGSETPLLMRDSEWFLGMEPRPTHVRDSTGGDGPYGVLVDNPLISEIDSIRFDWTGSIKLSSPAVNLVRTGGYSYFYPHRDSIDEYEPAVVAMSHYGRGTVFLHMDYSSMKYGLECGFHREFPDNMSINYDLPCCTNIPKFFHYPEPGTEFVCQNDTLSITTEITQFGILDPESLYVMWNGHPYDTSSIYIDVYESSFVFNIPPGTYHDHDTLFMCIHNIIDNSGYWYYDSICWSYTFNIDETSPLLCIIEPTVGETLSYIDRFEFTLTDSNGIDYSTISLSFAGIYEFGIDHSAMWREDDTIFFVPSEAGLSFDGISSLEICLHAMNDNPICPQAVDSCWKVYLEGSGMEEERPIQYILSAYPNPFNGVCNIDGKPGDKAEIFDQQGKLIKTITLPAKWNATDGEGELVPSGTYIILTKEKRIMVRYVK